MKYPEIGLNPHGNYIIRDTICKLEGDIFRSSFKYKLLANPLNAYKPWVNAINLINVISEIPHFYFSPLFINF